MKTTPATHPATCPQRRHLLPFTIIAIALSAGLTACSTSSHTGAHPAQAANANSLGLQLNNGKKWVVPKPMMVHLGNIEKEVQDFERTPGGDHAILARDLQEHLGRLVTNCTMEGRAHDELHKWLMPFLATTTEYSKATALLPQQEQLAQIKDSLRLFHDYFE